MNGAPSTLDPVVRRLPFPPVDEPQPGDLLADPEHAGRWHTVDHVLPDGDQLRVCSVVGHVFVVDRPAAPVRAPELSPRREVG